MKRILPFPRLAAVSLALCMLFASDARAALLLHYGLDQSTGATAYDAEPSPANGQLLGSGSSWTTEVPNEFVARHAYRNSGADDTAIDAGNVTKLNSLGSLTISGWVNVQSAVTTNGSQDRLLSNRGTTGGYFDLAVIDVTGGVGLRFELKLNNTDVAKSVTSTAVDFSSGWLYFAVTRDAVTGVVSIYVGSTDAAAGLQLITTGTAGVGTIDGSTGRFMIGNTGVNTKRSPKADYSDIRLYDTALSSSELNAIRKDNLLPIPEPTLLSLTLIGGLAGLWAIRSRATGRSKSI